MTDSNETPNDEPADSGTPRPRSVLDEWAIQLLAGPSLADADVTRFADLVDVALRDAVRTINAMLLTASADSLATPTVEIAGHER